MTVPRPIQRQIERLPTPPSPDEGEIEETDFDPTPITDYAPTRPCHECGDELDISNDSYIEAKVRLYEPDRRTGGDTTLFFPQFCSRECWSRWASRD